MANDTRNTGSTRVTIRTVAADAGVSVAAVSKVLRNAYGVSDALRTKVNNSIEKLGYRPSVAARGMRGQTYTIGVLLVETANPFVPLLLDGINSVLNPSNYKMLIGVGEANAPLEETMIESMIDHRMDGLILVAPRMNGERIAKFARQIPIAVIAHHQKDANDFDTANSDDFAGARMATQALIERGYTDIAMVTLPERPEQDHNILRMREGGYLASIQTAGLKPRMFTMQSARPDINTHVREILSRPNRPQALFCWSDIHAIPFRDEAHRLGIKVPEELAIIGYDNSPYAAMSMVDISSIDQNGPEIGKNAAEALLGRIEGRKTPVHALVPPRLVVRSSI